jgi:hypothetical protein
MAPHALPITPPQPSPPPQRPAVAQAAEATVGAAYVQLLQPLLGRLRHAYGHPNRVLHYDTVLTALLIGFYSTTIRSLRSIEDQSRAEGLAAQLPIERVCRSTLSDAMRQMDAAHLLPIVSALIKQVPALRRQDGDLHALLRRIIAADGSIFTVPADVLWAIALTRTNGRVGRQFRLNLQLDVLQFLPVTFSISGAADGSESAAFMRDLIPNVIYVADRNFVDFKFIHAVFDRGSDLVVRLKADTTFAATDERAITDADRAANVIADRVGRVPGSRNSPGFGPRPLREITLTDPCSGKPVRLLTNLLAVPARVIGLIYRHRWQIELFFKWLKCTARLRHLISESRNGITIQLYVAVIGVLLTHLRSGRRRPSLYAANCLAMVAAGQMSVGTMFQVLEQRDRERDLARARLTRKRQAAEKTVG